jgi:hypothetical protein
MFENYYTWAKKQNKLLKDLNKIVKKILSDKDLKEEIIRMNTYDQLYEEGIDSEGLTLGNYSLAARARKRIAGYFGRDTRADHITLRDTGKFYDSFKVILYEDYFVIRANTEKEDVDLAEKWGKKILGLTDENLGYVIAEVKKGITKEIRKAGD